MSRYKLGNYSFDSKAEYELAQKEYELIKQIAAKYNINDPKDARTILDRFYPKTKVGKDFEKKLSARIGVSYESVEETNKTHIPSATINLTPSGPLRIFLIVGFIISLGIAAISVAGFGFSSYLVVFLILAIGFAFHLNFGGIREKIPLLKKGSAGATAGFWSILCCLCVVFATVMDKPVSPEPARSSVSNVPHIATQDNSIPVYEPEISDKPTAQDYLDDYYNSVDSAPVSDSHTVAESSVSSTYMVWVTASGNKYHSRPDCGNMKNAYQMSLDEAISKGRTACKKCKP